MSLINQMLQDLEQRRTQTAADNGSVLERLNPGPVTEQRRRNNTLIVVISILLVIVIATAWQILVSNEQVEQPEPVLSSSNENQTPQAALPMALPQIENKAQAVTETEQRPAVVEQQVSAIAALPVQVEKQPQKKQNAIKEEQETLLSTAKIVTESVVTETSTPDMEITSAKKQTLEVDKPIITQSIKRKSVPSKEAQASSMFAEASRQLKQGQHSDARQSLKNVLKLVPGHIEARQTLAAIYFSNKQFSLAQKLLTEGRERHPQHVAFALLLARVHTELGRDTQAIAVLEILQPDMSQNSDYYALLAALYQRNANHSASASTYRNLLRVYPGRAVWWMGLGLSLQSLEQNAEALEAYRKAMAGQGISTELRRFVQSRIDSLR